VDNRFAWLKDTAKEGHEMLDHKATRMNRWLMLDHPGWYYRRARRLNEYRLL
jgi:hypothetical protein